MRTEIIKLSFSSEVHFGHKRLTDAEMTIQADTLFSALFIEALQLGLKTNFLLEDITISDTFPYSGDTYYIPKPFIQVPFKKDETNFKAIKKLSYLPYHDVPLYIEGEINSEVAEQLTKAFTIGESNTHTKVSIHDWEMNDAEVDDGSNLYTIGTFSFAPEAGLYFFVKGSEEALEKFNLIMNSLQYAGLGGKRSSGYGRFKYESIHDDALLSFIQQKGNINILLSSSMVDEAEKDLLTGKNFYSVQKKSGFIQSTTYAPTLRKKKDLYTFAAGSVFEQTFSGRIFNVASGGSHPVYRYAKAFWLEV